MGIRKGERKIDVKENSLIEEIEQNQECTRRDTKGNENGRMKKKTYCKKRTDSIHDNTLCKEKKNGNEKTQETKTKR